MFEFRHLALSKKKFTYRGLILQLFSLLKAGILTFIGLSLYYTVCFSFITPQRTSLMLKRILEQKSVNSEATYSHQWVPLEKISPHLIQAVIASEDNRFTKHYGIDLGAIKKAKTYNQRHTRRKRGASTISQQTAKNVFLWPARSYLRKGMEVYFTLLIETFWSKKRIMEVYLNMIEMGPGIYGAESASQQYFGKPASKLTKAESAMIAICLPNPRKRNPSRPTSYMYRRQQQILKLMPKMGKIEL